jgi:ribosome biogenesis GTPase
MGKSTLINLLVPGPRPGRARSRWPWPGRHTTTSTTWYWLDDQRGRADRLPGFQEFGLRQIEATRWPA